MRQPRKGPSLRLRPEKPHLAACSPRPWRRPLSLRPQTTICGSSDPNALLAAWSRGSRSFDLFIGGWEVRTARREGIAHWMVIPFLALTLFAGPIGLLLFLLLQWMVRARRTPEAQPA
ncbi:DUF4281 domain-containing protein [Halomonas denitrificans]|nr:DUF4281 domain-containing protein [Halomonas denitrificans]